MEYMKIGKLDRHIRRSTPSPQSLVTMATDIASGMNYLSIARFVVGVCAPLLCCIVLCCINFPQNLAARNILVDDNNVCKISDFGLSRDMSDPLNTVSSKQSFKWIALGLNLHGCLGDSLTLLRAPTSPGASTPRLC